MTSVPDSTPAQRPRRDVAVQVQRQAFSIRVLAFLAAAAILTAGIRLSLYPESLILLVAGLLLYPLALHGLGQWLQRRRRRSQPVADAMVLADAAMLGLVMAALQFALVPTLSLLLIVHASAVSRGGLRHWLLAVLATCVGASGGLFLFGNQWLPPDATPLLLTLISFAGLAAYVGAASVFAFNQTRQAWQDQERLAAQQRHAVELSRKLARYLPPQVWGQLFSGRRDARLETRRRQLTVFFSDIQGFSALSEALPLDTLTWMLNSYLNEMTRIALRHGGTVDKFIGDAVMVFFGDPTSQGPQQDARNAVAMALEMQRTMPVLRQRWARAGIRQRLEIRIGINTGFVTVGNFGADTRMDYTILGTDVNLASRLESSCRPGQVLISHSTWSLVRDQVLCRAMGEIRVKGFQRPITVYEAQALKAHAAGRSPLITASTEGFCLCLDLERIPAGDRNRILLTLARSARDLMQKSSLQLDLDTEGFLLQLDNSRLRERDCHKVVDVLGRAAQRLKQHTFP